MKMLLAGLLPLPLWLGFVSLSGWLAADYSPLADHASALGRRAAPVSSLVNIGFWLSGTAFIIFAIGLWARTKKLVCWGAICWGAFGASMISNGIWPMGTPMHGLYALGLVSIIAPAISALELEPLRDDKLIVGYTVFASLAAVFYLWLNLTGNDPAQFRGLTQRVFSSVNALWPFLVAIRLR